MKRMSLVVVLLVAVGLAASAQAGGDLGLLYKFDVAPSAWLSPNWSTFTIPSFHGVGVIYHVTDRLALMPTVFFGWGKLDYESGGSKTYDETLMAAGVEIDVPLYIKKSNNIRVFLAPGLRGVVGFFDYENLLDATDYEQTVYREVGARLNIGGQATFDRFAIVGSWGLRFDYVDVLVKVEGPDGTIKGPVFGTSQASVALVYYLRA